VTAWNPDRLDLLQLDLHLRHRDLLGRVHPAFDRRRARHLAAQIAHGEIVGGLRETHIVGDSVRNICGQRIAAWK